MKHKHKPTVVDAERFDGPGTLSPGFAAAICRPPCGLGGVRYRDGDQLPHIDTLHGPVQLEVGWWVVREIVDAAKFYPVHPDVFDISYEPCEGDDGPR